MFYKKTCIVTYLVLYLILIRSIIGVQYNLYSSNNDLRCDGGRNDTCDFWCDVDNQEQVFDCGNVDICNIHCDSIKCLSNDGGTLQAGSTKELRVYSSGSECLRDTEVLLPDNGDAYFINYGDSKSFKLMTITSGLNTGSIYITCDNGGTEECKQMEINAETAQYLYIEVGSGSNIMKDTNINCPVNSNHVSPSCVINTNPITKLDGVTINTQNGIPKDIWIYDELMTTIYAGVTITSVDPQCTVKLNEAFDKDTSGNCWNTNAPTNDPTINPTSQPTSDPSLQPTSNPTSNPTRNPTLHPTYIPTLHPTHNPSSNPTTQPTRQPTENPSSMSSSQPTDNPTSNPSINPSLYPTSRPTHRPTHPPTDKVISNTNTVSEPESETTQTKDDILTAGIINNTSLELSIFIIVMPSILICGLACCCLICIYQHFKRKDIEIQLSVMRAQSVISQSQQTSIPTMLSPASSVRSDPIVVIRGHYKDGEISKQKTSTQDDIFEDSFSSSSSSRSTSSTSNSSSSSQDGNGTYDTYEDGDDDTDCDGTEDTKLDDKVIQMSPLRTNVLNSKTSLPGFYGFHNQNQFYPAAHAVFPPTASYAPTHTYSTDITLPTIPD